MSSEVDDRLRAHTANIRPGSAREEEPSIVKRLREQVEREPDGCHDGGEPGVIQKEQRDRKADQLTHYGASCHLHRVCIRGQRYLFQQDTLRYPENVRCVRAKGIKSGKTIFESLEGA